MDCAQAREHLELLCLGEPDESVEQAVRDHASGCPQCAATVAEYRRLLARVQSGRRPSLPGDAFSARLGQAVRSEISRSRRWRMMSRIAAAASPIAAMVLVAAGVWMANRAKPPSSGVAPAAPVAAVWEQPGFGSAPAAGATAQAAVVHGSTLFALRSDLGQARVAAVDGPTGRVIWQSPQASLGYLAADDHRVYCLASAGDRVELVALSARTGQPLWRHAAPANEPSDGAWQSAPVVFGERVCWSTYRSVHVLASETGAAVWSRRIEDEGAPSAAVQVGSRVLVATPKAVHVLNAATGEPMQAMAAPADAWRLGRPQLAVDGGRVFVAVRQPDGTHSTLTCLDLTTGQAMWSQQRSAVYHLLADRGQLLVRAGGVQSLDGATGGRVWSAAGGGCGPITLDRGRAYYIDGTAGRLVALNARTGHREWAWSGLPSCDAFVPAGPLAYVKTRDGVLHAMTVAAR